MDLSSSFIDWIILGSGVYLLYCYFLMKTKGEVREGVLLAKTTLMKDCKDKEAYIREAAPKLLIYSIAVILFGILGILENSIGILGNWYFLLIAALLAITAWFAVQTKKLSKKYWP